MRRASLLLALAVSPAALPQSTPQDAPRAAPIEKQDKDEAARRAAEEAELQRAIETAGNDRAALVRNLENFLRRYPETPRKVSVYRALVEASMQLRDPQKALDYAERTIALRPDDSAMMLFAVELLERAGDEHSLVKAIGYASRVLDRLEKTSPTEKPARVSAADWELEQKRLHMLVYLIRGRLELERRNYDQAVRDLEASYHILPNASAALRLGEIAEVRKEPEKGIEHYLEAFVLPDVAGATVDRKEVRRKVGNLWRLVHGTEAGLGERMLTTYDRLTAEPKAGAAPDRNGEAVDPFAFVLRRANGTTLNLAELRGKILVLNFWATWCLPCRELEPLFDEVAEKFSGSGDVVFLAVNGDEDEGLVRPYLERKKMRTPVVLADGLDRHLRIRAIPTVIVLDRAGKIVYRAEGFAPEGFVEKLRAAIERAVTGAS